MKRRTGRVIIVDDDEHVVFTSQIILKEYFENIETLSSPAALESKLKTRDVDIVLLDMNFRAGVTNGNEGIFWMNRIHTISPNTQVVLQTAYVDISLAVKSIKEGAVDFLPKPWDREKLVSTMLNAWKLATSRRENGDLRTKQNALQNELNSSANVFIASALSMTPVLQTIEQVAPTDANVLILGENGTGKELIARAIHNQSSRKDKPFITVDLGAIPHALFESEMFGHEKGSFTDARDSRIGKFELANNGTLFLDEIGNLPLDLQVKMLSILQTRTLSKIGSNKTIQLNVRIISATNAPLNDLVSSGTLRQDLYYRVNTVEIHLPPLRERKEDIPSLVQYYLHEYCTRYRKQLTVNDAVMQGLVRYPWPGNIRELKHAVERAVILSRQSELTSQDFQTMAANYPMVEEISSLNLSDVEKSAIRLALTKCQGNLTRTAEELGIGRTTLYRKMEEYGINQ
jgi:two-component system response regulator HydG